MVNVELATGRLSVLSKVYVSVKTAVEYATPDQATAVGEEPTVTQLRSVVFQVEEPTVPAVPVQIAVPKVGWRTKEKRLFAESFNSERAKVFDPTVRRGTPAMERLPLWLNPPP